MVEFCLSNMTLVKVTASILRLTHDCYFALAAASKLMTATLR
jgi:hypothetical protein